MTRTESTKPKAVPFITSGAALCRALRENNTGNGKLDIIREALRKNPNLTAEEAYELLYLDRQNVTQRTLDKARGLIDFGKVPDADAVTQRANLEDIILADRIAAERDGRVSGMGTAFTPPPKPAAPVDEAAMRQKVEAEMRAKLEAEYRQKAADDERAAELAAQEKAKAAAEAEKAKLDAEKQKQQPQNTGHKPPK